MSPMNNRLLRPTTGLDPDAAKYLAAVEAADGEPLEPAVRTAISAFFRGLKATPGLFDSIKASCILAGARTLAGALVPLVGDAPTNVADAFVENDYSRTNGLTGDGATTYLNTGRANSADPQNDKHLAIYISGLSSGTGAIRWAIGDAGTAIIGQLATNEYYLRANDGDATTVGSATPELGFAGVSRASSATKHIRLGGTTYPVNAASTTPSGSATFVFRRNDPVNFGAYDGTLAFYSIGTSLGTDPAVGLADLDTAVSNLINAIGEAL